MPFPANCSALSNLRRLTHFIRTRCGTHLYHRIHDPLRDKDLALALPTAQEHGGGWDAEPGGENKGFQRAPLLHHTS